MAPLDYSKLTPVATWPAGPLRVCEDPARSDVLLPAERYEPYGVGYAIPAAATWVRGDGLALSLAFIDGAVRLVGLGVDDGSPDPLAELREQSGLPERTTVQWLTGKYLRSLPIDRAIAEAAQGLAVRLYRRPRGEVIGVNAWEAHAAEAIEGGQLEAFNAAGDYLAKLTTDASRPRDPHRRGRKPVPVEKLQRAAEIARRAELDGDSRIDAIAEEMDVQPSTAKKYLRLAREAHLLPPSTRGGRTDAH